MISFHGNISGRTWPVLVLAVLPPKAVAGQIERIAPCLGSSAVELTFPLNTAKDSKLSFATMAGDQVIFQDGIQLPRSPYRGRPHQHLSLDGEELSVSDLSAQ